MTGADKYERVVGQGPKVGWIRDEHILIDLSAAQKVVKQLSQATGNYLGSSDRAISKALYEANMLADVSKDRLTIKATVEGQRKSLLCIHKSLIIDIDCGADPPPLPYQDLPGEVLPF